MKIKSITPSFIHYIEIEENGKLAHYIRHNSRAWDIITIGESEETVNDTDLIEKLEELFKNRNK